MCGYFLCLSVEVECLGKGFPKPGLQERCLASLFKCRVPDHRRANESWKLAHLTFSQIILGYLVPGPSILDTWILGYLVPVGEIHGESHKGLTSGYMFFPLKWCRSEAFARSEVVTCLSGCGLGILHWLRGWAKGTLKSLLTVRFYVLPAGLFLSLSSTLNYPFSLKVFHILFHVAKNQVLFSISWL